MRTYKFSFLLLMILPLFSCDNQNNAKSHGNVRKLVNESFRNMVHVKGGDFLMGDFGPLVNEKLPYSPNQDDKVLHKVVLSDFSISKYKVTYHDYDIYTKKNSKPKVIASALWLDDIPKLRDSNMPVSVTWQQAKDYCLWLGHESGKKVNLPTEAQWEYAARARGKYLPYPTDNGKYEPGRNVANKEQIKKMTGGQSPTYPIAQYPENPIGLYDIGFNGKEWVNDWYSSEYYTNSKGLKDPQGPDSGEKKILRGFTRGDYHTALTMYRQSSEPIPGDKEIYNKYGLRPGYTFRCVINE